MIMIGWVLIILALLGIIWGMIDDDNIKLFIAVSVALLITGILIVVFGGKPEAEKIKEYKRVVEETKVESDYLQYKYKVKPAFEIPEQNIIVYEFEGSDGDIRYIAVSKTKITTINDRRESTGRTTDFKPEEITVDK